jgi:hypothetical protein
MNKRKIKGTQMTQIKQCRGVLHTPETSNAIIAKRHPFQINKQKMTDATNMSSSTNMSSLTGFLFADDYNVNPVIGRSAGNNEK